MYKYLAVLFLGLLLFCKSNSPVTLNIQFSPLDTVVYRLTYNSGGEYSWEDTSSDLSTTLECKLIGKHVRNNPGNMSVHVESTNILTNVLDKVEIFNMTHQLEERDFIVSYTESGIDMDKIGLFPLYSPEEHGFIRQLMKLTPNLPNQPVPPGFVWERESMHPVKSSAGTIPCTVYRSYSFDSLSSDDHTLAYISWKFRYMLDQKSIDTTSAVFLMPMAGMGQGNATINTTLHKIKNSEVRFITDEVDIAGMKLKWKEKAVMVMEEKKK